MRFTLPSRRPRPRGVRSLALALMVGLTTATLTTAGPGLTPAASAVAPDRNGVILGIVGDAAQVRQRTGTSLAVHSYGKFSGKVPQGSMVTVRSGTSWGSTASVKPGSSAYQDIVRWADTIKGRGQKTFVAFHHEPEATASLGLGTPAQYVAAYRKVVNIFRARGANNVVFTWQMTGWAFRADRGTRQYAAQWYPGDAYVDVVGADAYNWYSCGHGRGRWNSVKTLVDPALAFARNHGKQVALPEFGTVNNSRRAAWLTEAASYFKANDNLIAAVYYFHRAPTNMANRDCSWALSTSGDYLAIKRMAVQSLFRTS